MSDPALGPAMLALNDRQRQFVWAYCNDPTAYRSELARKAGYGDTESSPARLSGYRLWHDPKIQAAISEVNRSNGPAGAAIALAGLIEIASDSRHKDRVRALEALADRCGLPKQSLQQVNVTHSDETGEALIARIRQLGEKLGVEVDEQKLIGTNAIEAEFEVVNDGLQTGTVPSGLQQPEHGQLLQEGRQVRDERPGRDEDGVGS